MSGTAFPARLGILLYISTCVLSQYINFKRGFEYQYKYHSTADVKSMGEFHVLAKIGYTNIGETAEGQEIYVRVYAFQLKTKHTEEFINHQWDFSKWFSFVITPKGEIVHVYHPPKDDDEAVAIKKGAAAMFASRLHHSSESLSQPTEDGWTYSVREHGHEGEHDATYTVQRSWKGQLFTKIRHPGHHPVKHATSHYTKTLYFDKDLGTIHTVKVNEKFRTLHKTADGFDPLENARPVKAVNNFTQMNYPELSALGSGKLEFLTRDIVEDLPSKPTANVMRSSIHIKEVKRKKHPVDIDKHLNYIKGNLTCMRNEPEKGSKKLDKCFQLLVSALDELQDDQLELVGKQYLIDKPRLSRTFNDRNHMVDAIAALTSSFSQQVLLDHILNRSRPDSFLVKRYLVHVVNLDTPPIDSVITKLKSLCFDPTNAPPDLQKGETYHRIVLTMGVVARRLWDAGRRSEAADITKKLEDKLGLHDPWLFRKKRSVMTEKEMLDDDRWRVILLGSLGNAGLDQSYDIIVSHVNTSNSQWIKRAGIHAMRKYRHEGAAHLMLRTALFDDDEKVRYEAMLQYQAHPKAATVAPLYKQHGVVNGSIFYADPYNIGIHDIAVHGRHRRSFLDEKFEFRLASPDVDWKKMLGSTTIGASFGLLMNNALDLKIAPLSGHMKVNVHDEAYARIHLGFMGMNLDFFLARLCFKGRASYNLNLLQEFAVDTIKKLVELYDTIKGKATGAVGTAIELFRDIIKGEFSIADMIEDFKTSLEELPEKVINVGKKAVEAMEVLGEIDENQLPPFVRPAKNLVIKVSNLYKEVKSSVLAFYNRLMETVTVIIPRAGKMIYKSIQAIIKSFKTFTKDPKQAIKSVATNVFTIGTEVKNLVDAINKTKHALNHLREEPPDWMNLASKIVEIVDLGMDAKIALKTGGEKWTGDVIRGNKDPVAEFSKGKTNLTEQRKEVLRLLNEVVDGVLSPLEDLKQLGGKFGNTFMKVFKIIMDLKEAYNALKEGYRFSRSLIDRIFGPKCHDNFPRTIRQPGGGCGGSGNFPAELKNGNEYEHEGVDVTISEGNAVVAPFAGGIMLSSSPNEVIIVPNGGSLQNTEIIITNVQPNDTIYHPDDSGYVTTVYAGQPIGVVANSPCGSNEHIHFAMRRDGGYIDPTQYLEPRLPKIPEYIQECDDYKLVFKFEVLAEDCLICLNKKEEDTSPEREGEEIDNPEEMDPDKDPSADVDKENENPDSFFQRMKAHQPAVKEKAEKTKDGALSTLFKKAGAFLKKFSIRNLKMGTILDLLEILGLNNSMEKMAEVIKTIKAMIDNKPCFNPHKMTDDELRTELIDRGMKAQGTREDMIKAITTPSNSCPLMKISMPNNIYCTFDDMCLGLECCAHFKLFMFRKTFKVFARFDPCDFTFSVGAGRFNKTFKAGDGLRSLKGGFEKKLATGLKLNILGGIELVVKVKFEKDESASLITLGVGFCSQDNGDDCIAFFNVLDEAVTPLPICNADGTMTWPEVDFRSYFNKDSIKKRIRESAKKFAKQVIKKGAQELIGLLPCISSSAKPCPRPEVLTTSILKEKLQERGLDVSGSRSQLVERLSKAHRSCNQFDKSITLPKIPNKTINKMLYLQISPNCLRFDACLDINIKTFNFSKAVNAYVDLDPCNFTLTLNFEECTETNILLGFAWGEEKEVDLKGLVIRYKVGRDDFNREFIVDLGLKVQFGNSKPLLDKLLLKNKRLPMPVCHENFTISALTSIKELAKIMGGKLVKEAVVVIFKKYGLDKIFPGEQCTEPPVRPTCRWSLPNYKKQLPASFEDNVKCQHPDNCFGIHCCVDFKIDVPYFKEPFVKNVPFFMKFEPCNFTVEIGFGSYYHKEVLLTYNWGTETSLGIGSGNPAPVDIRFKVSKYPLGFILDLTVHTCIPIDDDEYCFPHGGMLLLKKERVPACDASTLLEYTRQNFSVSEWLKDGGLDINLKSLSQAAAQMLLDKFGVSEYILYERCDDTRPPYTPSVDGWRNECPKSILRLPRLPQNMYCHLADTCTKISCCFDVPFLKMSFSAVLDINMCDYSIHATIENQTTSINMLGDNADITTGITKTLDIRNVFELKFGVKKKDEDLIIDLDIHVCFEKDVCVQKLEVLKGTEVPHLICEMDASWNLRNFSLADWAWAKGQDLGQRLSSGALALLLQQLGIKDKILDPPCDRKSLKYLPADPGNWKSDCNLTSSALSLPSLKLPANCYINDKCLGIDCCMHSNLLNLSLHTTFNIDLCNYIIEGSIEKYSFKHYILDYKWGTQEEATLDGVPVIRIKYKVDRLLPQQVFIVDLSASLCMEGDSDSCGFELKVMDQSKLPMPICAKFKDFKVPDFSLGNWIRQKGGEITAELSALLFQELGIKHLLLDRQCQSYREPYKGAVNGWKNDCPDLTLPNLPQRLYCHVTDYCTGISCCAEVSMFKHNFNAYIYLDSCNYNMRVGIEKLEFTSTLFHYKWGELEVMDIGGPFRMEYKITAGEKQFLIDLSLKVCLTAGKNCQFTLPVFKGMILPKPLCDWEATKHLTGFSLAAFVKTHGESLSGPMSKGLLDKLFYTLGVTPFLLDTACEKIPGTANGWTSACPKNLPLPNLPTSMSCSIPDHCNAVDCCLDVPVIKRNVNFKVDLDVCKMTLTLTIEKLEYKTLLFKYNWGQPNSFHLKKIFRADYIIDNLEAEKEFVLSLNISVCFEAGQNCFMTTPVLKQARFPNPVCDWNSTLSLRGFSLSNWLNEHELGVGQALTAAFRFKLAVALGISQYLLYPMCNRQQGIYIADSKGWNKACPKAVSLPKLPDSVSCHITDYCTGLDCCVSADSLGLSFNFKILLDTRNLVLTIGIEKLEFKTSLFGYKWGEWEFFNLNGVVRLGFKIEDLHHAWKYLLSVKVSLCFEANKPCLLDVPLFTDVTFPKIIWNWDNPFSTTGKGFSLKSWLSQMQIPSAADIAGVALSQLMNKMGITNYLKDPQCNRLTAPYTGAMNGWKKDCPVPLSLPTLPDSAVCHLSNPCGTVECCIDIGIIKRSVGVKIGIDPCTFTFTMGIEKLVFTRALSSYKWGKVEHFNLKKFVRIEFMIDDLFGEKKFLINMTVRVCFEDESCILSFPVLQDVKIPKLICDWHSTQALADFSLDSFLSEMKATELQRLPKAIAGKLFERLEIGGYLQSQQCQLNGSPYNSPANGWKNGCPVPGLDQHLPNLPNFMACHVPDMCTAFDCCVNIDYLSHSFHVFLSVDMCSYQLTVGVENLVHKHMLFNYQWGKDDHFYVKGVIRIDFKMNHLQSKRKLELTASLSVCLKPNDCLFSRQLLDKAQIPQPVCDWQAILNTRDFSLTKWASDKGLSSITSSLTETLISQLLDDLGVSQYLQSTACNQTSSAYSPANINNWKQDCSTVVVPSLPDSAKCHLSSNCSTVDCCVNVGLVKRNIRTKFDVDICNLEITLTIEKFTYKVSLLNYKWGTTGYFLIGSMTRLIYKIIHISSSQKLILSLNIKVCFEDNSCSLDIPVFSQSELVYSLCNPILPVPFKGVSFDFWKPEQCLLETSAASSSCSVPLSPALTKMCQLTDNCMGIKCCVDVDLHYLGVYSLTAGIRVDHCKDKLHYFIENKQWTKNLQPLDYDKNHTESIGSAIRISYLVSKTTPLYKVSFHIKICALNGYDYTDKCNYYKLLDKLTITTPSSCVGQQRKKRSVLEYKVPKEELKIALNNALNRNFTNGQIGQLFETFKEEEKKGRLTVEDLDDSGAATNPRTTVRKMGTSNPGTILYSGEVGGGNVVMGMEGGEKIMKVLGTVTDVVGRGDQAYTVGKGLTGKGLELLGAKLANMSIGEMIALFDAKNIDPELALRLTRQLRDLVLALYSDIVNAVLNGDAGDMFSSFDLTLQGDFSFPRQTITFFRIQKFFLVGGLVPMTFEFGAGASYGMQIIVGAKILGLTLFGQVIPYGSAHVYGELGIGFVLYGKLRFDGYLMSVAFPSRAEIGFYKFPLDLSLIMDLELIALEMTLKGLVTIEINLLFKKIKHTLYQATIWRYATPIIRKRLVNTGTKEPDATPPQFLNYVDSGNRKKRAVSTTRNCLSRQLANRDYTEPAVEIAMSARDDKSQVQLYLSAGTKPGLSDVFNRVNLGGPSAIITEKFKKYGVPIFFTVFGENSGGTDTTVTCSIPTYDITVPGGRLTADFRSTSNPSELQAHVVVYEDSELLKSNIGVGLGQGIYADEIISFRDVDLKHRENAHYNPDTDHFGHQALEHFTGLTVGRLVGPVIQEFFSMNHAGSCVKECMKYPETKCMSVNYDYGPSGHCELLEAIEGHHFKMSISGQYSHYERQGVGLAYEFTYGDLSLLQNAMYYFSMHLVNVLSYESILHSEGVLVDVTPPEPGPLANITLDVLEVLPCKSVIPDDRPDWKDRCRGVNENIKNHRIIHDGPGSRTLFNGDTPLTDLRYTRANRYLSANWDGILDKETGMLGYSITYGTKICEELIHPHHDPHKHLFDQSEWTHSGLISPIPAPFDPLPDGRYYVTLRALNKVDYGGPLVTTICHSQPLCVDNSPPILYEIYNITYDDETNVISAVYNFSDPESDIREIDLCLGQTTRDCYHLDWQRSAHEDGSLTRTYQIPGGTPVWIKLRAVNHVDLMKVGVADHPIVIDVSPPEAGDVFDGPVFKHDLNFTKDADKICANWFGFYDPESGISHYEVAAMDDNGTEISESVRVDHKTHGTCVDLPSDRLLEHGKTYSFHITAFNAAHKQLNVSEESDGVIVDLTHPVPGEVVDGRLEGFQDQEYSTHVATVGTQWRGYTDPESDIREYAVKILRAKDMSSDFEVLKDWKTLNKDVTEIEWHNFHLNHRDIVKTTLQTSNNALGTVEQTTSGFVVDLTPPRMTFLGDGIEVGEDIEYQQSATTVEANFAFTDDESDLDHYKYQVYEHFQGRKHQIYPLSNGWDTISDATSKNLSQGGLNLKLGAMYSVRVGAVNKAGAIATYDTNGVFLDNTKPKMSWVYVGVFSGSDQHVIDGYVIQSDPNGIKASWFGKDHQSRIKSYMIAVGTTSGGTDILDWMDAGSERDRYLDGLSLNVTDPSTNSPVYYVSVKATNGAGLTSDVVTSSPIRVVEQDKAGLVIDGADSTEKGDYTGVRSDSDFQREAGLVTVQFSEFESHEHGVVHYDWAVGTTPDGEDVQPFITAGLVHKESETNVPGNGISTMGFGQAILPLVAGTKYFTTVRGITNKGNVLQASSDGFVVDISPPAIDIESYAKEDNKTQLIPNTKLYQTEIDSLSSLWKVADSESPVKKMFYSVGTYPHGEDVQEKTEIEVMLTGEGALPTGIKPTTDGRPNILTLTAVNNVGLASSIVSPTLVVDITPPTEGILKCPSFIQPHSAVECTWEGFFDAESNIEEFEIAVGSHEGLEDVIPPITLPGHTTKYLIQGLGDKVSHGQRYYAKVKATNTVGKTSSSISDAINVDSTPPKVGTVVELSSAYIINVTNDIITERLNKHKCNSEQECLAIDAVCQESLSSVNIAWQTFTDKETDIVKYEVAVGNTPGGGQLRGFYEVKDITQRYMAITGLILKGERQVFVTVKGTNGAGLSSISTSNGIYMSYLSQGLDPLSHVGVWDGDDHDRDLNFQTRLTRMDARWDVSGDPCPVVKYEWAIQRADGLRVQDFIDMEGRTHGTNDQLSMKNSERYYQYLRVTNALNYIYTVRSNGITVEVDPLVPGQVNDGDVIGFDLEFLRTKSKISANWDMFGSDGLAQDTGIRAEDVLPEEDTARSSHQEVAFYEVAVGSDRRFPKTRDNVVPFTNVGLNKTVTFYDLDLTPYSAMYYFTVRAHSKSGSKTDVTSNGFSVGFDGGVEAGYISMKEYINTNTFLDVPWDGFESQIGMMMYYVGLSNNTDAENYLCGQFTERGSISDEERQSVFNVVDIRNVGKDTFVKFENLALEQNSEYYAWVIGADKAGKCNMTSHMFTVDITPPTEGKIRTGPYYDLKLGYSATRDSLQVNWKDFSDEESGLRCYHASLYKKTSCSTSASVEKIVDSVEINSNYTSYKFMDLNMQGDIPYFARLVAENYAGLKTTVDSPPVLFDNSKPSSGVVIDGHNFTGDISWTGTRNTVKGSFLHHPVPDVSPCPVRQIKFDDTEWKYLESDRNYDSNNNSLGLTYRSANVHPQASKVDIKLARDSKKAAMFSGSYYRDADLVNGGEYKISIRAAGGEGKAVTSVMFWDGPEEHILNYDYTSKPDWSLSNCACCLEESNNTCKCNCEQYLAAKEYYRGIAKRSVPDLADTPAYSVRRLTKEDREWLRNKGSIKDSPDIGNPDFTPRKACGLQIYSGDSDSKLVSWCTYGDYLNEPLETVRDIETDLSQTYHDYIIKIATQMDEARGSEVTWCMTVTMDGDQISEQCGIPRLSSDTKLFLGVWNHKKHIPDMETDEEGHLKVWSATASFINLIMPPEKEKLCRYGTPFQGASNAIVRYEAAIGSASGLSDVVDFQPVYTPCIPCLNLCDQYTCDPTCDKSKTVQVNITINDLSLQETTVMDGEIQPVIHYLTVKAVLGSGMWALASSDGFNIDTTPPEFLKEVLLYMDVAQGEFTPVSFQGSNDTIKAVWKCNDNESEIVNYEWKIGLQPGGDEIQEFESAGEFPGASNSGLAGILEQNTTYYVTVRCTNGGGLSTTYEDMKGVTVLLEPPIVENINTTIDADPLGDKVIPPNSMKTKKQHTTGASWSVADDPSVRRYDYCVGSSTVKKNDIFPCTMVGYNESGSVSVEDGYLKLNRHKLYKLSQYRPDYNRSLDQPADKNAFTMAPGSEMYIHMKMCNEARLCDEKLLGTTVVETDKSQLRTSLDGSALRINLKSLGFRRKRDLTDVSIQTPAGLKVGQSVVITELTETDLQTKYRSDASVEFVPYITNPKTTVNDNAYLDRILRQRLQFGSTDISFSVTSIGGLPLPGPLIITYPYDANGGDTTDMLLHWNPEARKWQQSNKTCLHETDTEVRNIVTSQVTVKICDTRSVESSSSLGKSGSDIYFSQPTQFLITAALSDIPNDPPELTTPTSLIMEEDGGTLIYQMTATDADEDVIKFKISPEFAHTGHDIELSEDGLMIYTPAPDYHGSIVVPILVYEVGLVEIRPKVVQVSVNINVTSVNDPPVSFAFSNQTSILHPDPTHPVTVLLEQVRANDTDLTVYKWVFGVYDTDSGDSLTLYNTESASGNLTIGTVNTTVPCMEQSDIPCDQLSLPHPATSLNWMYRTFTYQPDEGFYGYDEVRVYAKDREGTYSDVVTLRLVVMERPCQNGAACKSKDDSLYSCDDTRRAEGFDLHYTCECAPGWRGSQCDDNIDECTSSPCSWPYACYDQVNNYRCACPALAPNCDGIQAWMIGLVVLAVILVAIMSFLCWYLVMVKRGRLRWSALWDKVLGTSSSSASTGRTSFFRPGFSDDYNKFCDDDGSHGEGKTSPGEGASWVIYSGNPLYAGTSAIKSDGEGPFKTIPNLSGHEAVVSQANASAPDQDNGEIRVIASSKKKSNYPKRYSIGTIDHSLTPVEDDRPGSSEALIRSITPQQKRTLTFVNEPAPDYDK